MKALSEEQKYDPWEIKQDVTDIKVKVHCCRYWMLKEWECDNMAFPFWRLYHSRTGGSYVNFEQKEVQLVADKLILIPPYTSFSSRIQTVGNTINESIKGIRIKNSEEITNYSQVGLCDQFFVHFNLGYPFDKMKQGIYEIDVDNYWNTELIATENERLNNQATIDFQSNLRITGIILFALRHLSASLWNLPIADQRILKAINHIDKHLAEELDNSELSKVTNLATNSFARLFKQVVHCSAQQYIQQRRIDQAITYLHHTSLQIDEISLKCGFYDRHHFSKVFKKHTGMSPAFYRNKFKQN